MQRYINDAINQLHVDGYNYTKTLNIKSLHSFDFSVTKKVITTVILLPHK